MTLSSCLISIVCCVITSHYTHEQNKSEDYEVLLSTIYTRCSLPPSSSIIFLCDNDFHTSSSFLPSIVIRTFCRVEEAKDGVIRLSSSTIAVVSMSQSK